jgi:hypothetical protein
MPDASEALRRAAVEEAWGMLEVIACSAQLLVTGPATEHERRLAAAIELAVGRARRAVRYLAT